MQSKIESLYESLIDIGIGFVISFLITFIINYIHEIEMPVWKNFSMTCCFTVTSLIRRYIVRRYFNKKEKQLIK